MIFLTSFNNFSSSFANPDEDLINEALPVTETLPVAVELNYQGIIEILYFKSNSLVSKIRN